MLKFRQRSVALASTHEDLFLARYDRLLNQAISLTAHNKPLAEDLVQEAYVQFTLARPDLNSIENLDGYLYGMIRKMHISHLRRASRLQSQSQSLTDYERLDWGLAAIDANAQIHVHEELRQICHYACVRRASSKAGSVLLLRFFHGYYPLEIAQLIGSPRSAVDDWLRIARREAKLYLSDPQALSFMSSGVSTGLPVFSLGQTPFATMQQLRRAIFADRHGHCFTDNELQSLYQSATALDSSTLSELVSCPNCLDRINHLLNLPPLSTRYPVDMLSADPGSKKDDDDDPDGGGTGSMNNQENSCRRRARETFEHRPTELLFSVNGYVLSSLGVNAERNEQSQSISLDEKVSFVEVFSEQGVRLLFLDVESPPDGAIIQRQQIKLSDERELALSLDFSGAWPNLHAIYRDPLMAEQRSAVISDEAEDTPDFEPLELQPFDSLRTRWQRLKGFLLRPATITATIAMLLIASLVLVRMPGSTALAAELLNKAAALEKAMAARTDQALHRTINLEERNAADGKLLSRRRIEIWHSGEKRATARRVFDERNRLLAGEWRKDTEAPMVWRQGEKLSSSSTNNLSFAPENIWLLSPSAQDFTALISNVDDAKVEDKKDQWQIRYDGKANQDGLVSALLTLSKDDLHAVEQKLIVRNNTSDPALREYRFTETSFERRAPDSVAPAVFEPDAALLISKSKDEDGKMKDEANADASSVPATTAMTASAELEIEALDRMNRANALTGEQLSLTRTPEGKLFISGYVETAERKAELLRALDAVAKNPAVKVDIQTVAEALARQKKSPRQVTTLEQVEITNLTIPVEAELTQHLSARLDGAQLDEEIKRFSTRVLSQSSQARQHALALKQIAERFSAAELAAMDATARQRWQAMIRDRAQALRRTLQQLRQELAPIFPASSVAAHAERAGINEEDLSGAVQRLFVLVVATDSGTKKSFSLSTAPATNAAVKTSQYWRNLGQAEALATGIAERK